MPTADRRLRTHVLAAAAREEAGARWRALEGRAGDDRLTCSWAWTGTWLEHYGDDVPHRFVVGIAAGEDCGIALVTEGVGRRRGPFGLRSAHLGTAGERPGEGVYVQCNRLLCAPEHRRAFAGALLAEMRRDPHVDELHLDGFAPEDAAPLLDAAPGIAVHHAPCPTADLRAARAHGGDVTQVLSPATRKKLRRSLRGLGDVETEWAQTPEHALDILEELIVLHQDRWTAAGQLGAFASARFSAFHRALVPRLIGRRAAVLFRVRAASGTVGCEYGFVDGRRILSYQSGLARYADPQIRPGFVADLLCMQAAYDRGLDEYDFLSGDSVYKRQLSNGERALVWARWRRPALRWAALDLAAAARRRVRASSG